MKEGALAGRIRRFADRLREEDVNMHGFLLSIGGQEKARAYYAPFREGQPHRLYSVSKTITGLAVGILLDEGRIGLDDRIADYFRDWLPEKPDERLLRLTIRDMLRMATCYRATVYKEGADRDWSRPFFASPATHEPGTVFFYDTGCSQAFAALVRRVSGKEVMELMEERLFAPLGCRDKRYWLRDPAGCCQGGTGLCMSLRDMHLIGECLLRGGGGLLPRWYVEEMQKKHIDTPLQTNQEERWGYGWQCWRTRAGFAMYGMGGQLSVICPDKRAVLSTIADTRLDPVGVQRIYNAFFEEVYPFLGSEDTAPVTLELQAQALPDRAEAAMPAAGEYLFAPGNPLGLRRLRLEGDCLWYENARGPVSLPFGRGRVKEITYPGWDGVPALSAGGWIEKGLLRVRCHAVGDAPCGFDMLLRFTEKTVAVQCRKSNDPVTAGYDGVASGCLAE